MREMNDVRLRITSLTLTAQQIEARIGCKPNEGWNIGDRRGTFGAPARENGVIFESGAPISAVFADYLTYLMRKLSPYSPKIGGLAAECTIEVVYTLHRKVAPMLAYSREEIYWFATIGARLCIDTFLISDAPRVGARAPSAGGAEAPKF